MVRCGRLGSLRATGPADDGGQFMPLMGDPIRVSLVTNVAVCISPRCCVDQFTEINALADVTYAPSEGDKRHVLFNILLIYS